MRGIAVIALLVSFLPHSGASAQQFDPKEAVIGAWQLDFETAIVQAENETDPDRRMGMQMLLGMASSYAFEIRDDGSMLMGGVQHPSRFIFETDEEGILWMIPTDNSMPQMFNRLEFDGADRVSVSSTTDDQMQIEIPLVRMFPAGMLSKGAVDPDSEAAIQGWWTVEVDQIQSMPWVEDINDERIRAMLLRGVSSKSMFAVLGFFDGTVYAYSDEFNETMPFGPYTIRATDGDLMAISILIDRGADSESPLLRINRKDKDRIELLMLHLAPGPLPMVRRDDVEPPTR